MDQETGALLWIAFLFFISLLGQNIEDLKKEVKELKKNGQASDTK